MLGHLEYLDALAPNWRKLWVQIVCENKVDAQLALCFRIGGDRIQFYYSKLSV